jgi:hypothetical protein
MEDTGKSLGSVRSAIESVYPLFFCEEPDDEPTCVPTRDEYGGIADGDRDGDGVSDDSDNCPDVFNPVRPLDDAQPDADGDDLGDVCDLCPLDAGESCGGVDANDLDGDGVRNGADNCMLVGNADQADEDGDGHGDACDTCAQPNPGPTGCALSIKTIRDPNDPDHPAPGTPVTVQGVWVTAVRPDMGGSRGFHIQEDPSAPYSAIFVYTGGDSPGVQVGDVVDVSGVYEEFFEFSEISGPTVTVVENGSLPFDPLVVDPADVATGGSQAEELESMLLRVEDVAITVQNPDDPDDFDEFEVTGGLRIDDGVADGEIDSGLNNDTCTVGAGFDAIVGVLAYSFENTKLQPRGPEDVEDQGCSPF